MHELQLLIGGVWVHSGTYIDLSAAIADGAGIMADDAAVTAFRVRDEYGSVLHEEERD